MKIFKTSTGKLYIGTAREICSLYKNLSRRKIAEYIYNGTPRFNMSNFYGLCVDDYDTYTEMYYNPPKMTPVTADTALAVICGER
jgi:hypothetical protein